MTAISSTVPAPVPARRVSPLSGMRNTFTLTWRSVLKIRTNMSISSEAFVSGMLAQRYTCHGAKTNPPLNWSGAPAGTKSLALIVDDSSAPITPTIYWLVFDINPGATDIQEGALPTGARQALNSAGTATYDAPCPRGRPHSYRFTIYALNTALKLPTGAPLQSVWTAIAAATIGRGRIVVTGNP